MTIDKLHYNNIILNISSYFKNQYYNINSIVFGNNIAST